ncbi:conserved hypothetical protein [Culex quinquefasciatus]|uniref:GPS domain-containing protein n=1 Tax=Culex quinquefasciatus TaxID=7176 RepID=B0W608_CULQU|nr:conserved hypothetical protein [Culex quinquefasciatus]|eukprot:XP_001844142.1 conserved hypothetical protein [Culex quinquefasciatus]
MRCLGGVLAILALLIVVTSAEDPSFRILAPKFICGKSKAEGTSENQTDSGVSQQITIGLQTKGGQKLKYRVTVTFTLPGFVSQRHTLQLWKSVRQLEQRLEKERDAISDTNQILIMNEELVAGVIYTFNIVAIGEAGPIGVGQNFTIMYRGRNSQASVDQDGSSNSEDVSLLLLGAEVCYADIPYILKARLIFCEPKNDYTLAWSITGVDHVSVNTESSVLQIPPGVLSPGSTYSISVRVVGNSSGNEIVKATMKLTVLKRPLMGNIYPFDATVGFAQTTEARVAYNKPVDEVSWECRESADISCTENLIQGKNLVTTSFLKESKFQISASVEQLTLVSNIKVNAKSTISVTLQKTPPLYLIPGNRYEVTVDVAGLVPKCTSNWTLSNEEGFAYFDTTAIGGLGSIFINDIEENFLSELVDYGNDTVEREVRLIIPKEAELARNALYKFRLVTTCPEPIDDSVDGGKTRGSVASHWDMVLETNGPPSGLPLTVVPADNGTALNTFYTLSTGIANDTASDFPLRYTYWYVADGNTVQVGDFYEVMSTETQLPYSEKNVSVFYTVCDARQACSRIDGPQLRVRANPSIGLPDVLFRLDAVQKHFARGNYQDSMKVAFETLLTLKNQASGLYDEAYSRYTIILESQIKSIKEAFAQQSSYITQTSVLQFALQAKAIIDFKRGSNDHLLGELLELIDSVDRKPSRRRRAANPEPILTTKEVDSVTAKLEVYKSIVNSPSANLNGTNQLLAFIPNATRMYCEMEESRYSGEDGWLVLETKRLKATERNLLSSADRIPSDNPRVSLRSVDGAKTEQPLNNVSLLCLGKILFGRDILVNGTGSPMGMYQVILVVVYNNATQKTIDWKEGKYVWNVTVDENAANYECQVWNDDTKWSSKSCNSSYLGSHVVCECTQLNYLRIIPANESAVVEITTISTTTTQLSKEPTSTAPESVITTGSDMVTFSPTTDAPVSPTTPTSSAPATQPSTPPKTTSPAPATQPPTPPKTNSTTVQILPPSASPLNSTQMASATLTSSGALGYSILGALALCAVLTMAAFVLYHRRRNTTSLVDELQGIAGRVRAQSLPVRYARFQDEHNMSGDNVSTISDTVTV